MASIFKQQYTAKNKTGRSIRKQSISWYIDYKDSDGTRKRVKAFRDKAATAQLAAKLEREAALAQAGIIDKFAKHRKRALLEHLSEFKAHLLDKNVTPKQASLVYSRARAVIEACKFVFFDDISASKVQSYLAERRRGGLSTRTSNFLPESDQTVLQVDGFRWKNA